MKIALYTRVSTHDQSVEMQLSDLRRFCKERKFEVFKEYNDEGISGAIDKRPALEELMADARKRKFDAVLCWRFDRFARSTKHLITALEEFRHLGIEFISYYQEHKIVYIRNHIKLSLRTQKACLRAEALRRASVAISF